MVDKRIIEFVITEQQEEIALRSSSVLCRRAEQSLVGLDSPLAQVVIGVRRSGKSTLCYQALHGAGVAFAYVDFDDERLVDLKSEQLNDVLEVLYKVYGHFTHLFLDEIQNVDGWHLFVNRLLRKGLHVVVTGSNARLLSGELATHLTGRNKEIELYPFSFGEYCELKQVDTARLTTEAEAARRAAFDCYMQQGGFPEIHRVRSARSYVNTLVNHILKRDIEQRFRVAYTAALEAMTHHLLNVAPTIVVVKDLAELFGIKSAHAVKNYVDYLKQAYILIGVAKYSAKSRLRVAQEKVYAVDVALLNQRSNALVGANLGFRLETIVLIELKRRCSRPNLDIYYFRERSGECDFLVCEHNRVLQAIQVSYDISSDKTLKREVNGLLMAAAKTGCDNLLLITDHESRTMTIHGRKIVVQPAYQWCLAQSAF